MRSSWFYSRLQKCDMSLRTLASHMGMEPSGLSRAFHGKRKITTGEAVSLANHLGVPTLEILRHLGPLSKFD